MSESHEHEPEQDFEKLSKAITEAVMTSLKVRKIVEEIQKKTSICPKSFMVLVLKMEVLADALELDIEETPVEKKKPKRSRKKSTKNPPQQIDGKKLTANEIAFEEYARERFNAEKWLKENSLIF